MLNHRCQLFVAVFFPALFGGMAAGQSPSPADLAPLMPREEVRTQMWWRDGFPGTIEGAPWHRCVGTGKYAFVLDTKTLTVPHLGAWDGSPLSDLPRASLGLSITVDGKRYHCDGAEHWARFTGPRLIESGRFLQRADVTNLVFIAEDGSVLNAETRFETAAWSDRLALILAARPGQRPIEAGESSFGRVRGGFGLDGSNRFDVPAEEAATPEEFTLVFWVFVPSDFRAGKHAPWLLCKNAHEQADGNYGIMLDRDAIPEARINLGGGRENAHAIKAERRHALKRNEWNHLAISYDGEMLRLFTNGIFAVEHRIGKSRVPRPGNLTIGDRGDGLGDGAFRFRGVIDEVRLFGRALSLGELRRLRNAPESFPPDWKPIGEWTFRDEGKVSLTRLSEEWNSASLELTLSNEERELNSRWELPRGESWTVPEWQQAALMIDPADFRKVPAESQVTVEATELVTNTQRPVTHEPSIGWHRINLDGIDPIPSAGAANPSNDAIERIKLQLSNPSGEEQIARLMFEKTARGIRQRIGTPITGMSAILRDAEGHPTGIPVQLSKNWHRHPEGGVYNGQWFHGVSQLRLPPGAKVELELVLAYGHWGGVAAASHAQLSLIGWGGNQLWDQSAIGSWGESICFNPEQTQAACTITDVRPVMVKALKDGGQWNWTNNHGGGDFFRLFHREGSRIPHARMRTIYHRQGPCLTEVTYHGQLRGTGIQLQNTVSLGRTDDLTRGTYRLHMRVTEPVDFSRFVIFQIGADTYSSTGERKMAVGDESGLVREWDTQWGGNVYRGEPIECQGTNPWASLHDSAGGKGSGDDAGAWANRGIVIRDWKARIGGKEARPWLAERGVDLGGNRQSSTLDLVPPPGINRLEPGDFVEATIEHLIMPRAAADYYGPNEALRAALEKEGNSWQMIHREAAVGKRQVAVQAGQLVRLYPDIRLRTDDGAGGFTLAGGVGYVPITFEGLASHRGYSLTLNGEPLDQGVHGNDFWQNEYDPGAKTWSRTYNVPAVEGQSVSVRLAPDQK